jgi:hypothetical protein
MLARDARIAKLDKNPRRGITLDLSSIARPSLLAGSFLRRAKSRARPSSQFR